MDAFALPGAEPGSGGARHFEQLTRLDALGYPFNQACLRIAMPS